LGQRYLVKTMNKPAFSHHWKQRDTRSDQLIIAKMRGTYTIPQDIIIRNFSSNGLGARARDCPPGLGETVTVAIGPITVKGATVQWVRGDRFGVRFHDPLSQPDHDFLNGRADRNRPGFDLF
jgi:hypothetical protein